MQLSQHFLLRFMSIFYYLKCVFPTRQAHQKQHSSDIPGSGCAGCRISTVGWTGATTDQGSDPVGDSSINLLWRNKLDMAVDASGADDQVLARNDFRTGAHELIKERPRSLYRGCQICSALDSPTGERAKVTGKRVIIQSWRKTT
jgi:hypothetical protein